MSPTNTTETDEPEPPTTAERLLTELGYAVEPLAEAASTAADGNPDELIRLLDDLGLGQEVLGESLGSIETKLRELLGAWSVVQAKALSGSPPLPADFEDVLEALGTIFRKIDELSSIRANQPDFAALGERMLDYLLVRYLRDHHHEVYNVLCLIGVVREGDPDELHLSAFREFFEQPLAVPAQTFGWKSDAFEAVLVLHYLKDVLWRLGATPAMAYPDEPTVAGLQGAPMAANQEIERQLVVPVLQLGGATMVGVKLVPLPGTVAAMPGLAVVPFGVGGAGERIDLGGGWTFNADIAGALEGGGLAVRPNEIALRNLDDGSAVTAKAHGEVAIRYESFDETEYATILGDPDGLRLAVGAAAFRTSAEYDGTDVVFDVGFPVRGRIVIEARDADSFLRTVLPPGGFGHDFDVTVGWNSKGGVYFDRGGTLEAALPQHVDLGLITLNEVYLGVAPRGGKIDIDAAASAAVRLGPVQGVVERMGLRSSFEFPAGRRGNLGPLDVGIGFSPPRGIGLSIDAGAVVGGGYLYFDYENAQYAGVLELQIGTLSLTAIGLLTTRLPDGTDGFSLLIIITGEFPPIQLGYGFTLNAVGGLAGINRSTQVETFQRGIRTGSLNSVLFPRDPIRNAPQIISDLRNVFPATRDRYVFGPMARLGWGTPTLITAEIGVLLELPSPIRLLILGRLKAALPEERAALVLLQMDALGVIDFGDGKASVDATLYDSRVAGFTLTGDMAMRASWKDDPGFGLSVGGFNPRFARPPQFPELRRVTLALGTGNNPRLRCEAYLALTSNTAQFGAAVDLYAEAAGFSIDGHLGFDALFQFSPFSFIVDFDARMALKGPVSLSIGVAGSFAGPNPWHVRGKASFEVCWVSFEVAIDKRFGPSESPPPVPPAKVLHELTAAVTDHRNWSAQRPRTPHSFVTLRDVDPAGEVLAHPLGELAVRQRVVPLGIRIDKYGNAMPADYRTFTIENLRVSGGSPTAGSESLSERFAAAQFFAMSDAEKLSKPYYEEYMAGRRIHAPPLDYGGKGEADDTPGLATSQVLEYENKFIDRENEVYAEPLPRRTLSLAAANAFAPRTAVAKSDARTTGDAKFAGPSNKITVEDTRYVVARTATMARRSVADIPAGGTTYAEAEQALERYIEHHSAERGKLRVVGEHEIAAVADGGGHQ